MGQGFLRGQGGLNKIYILADCTMNSSTLSFPSGVTWGDIDMMAVVGINSGSNAAAWSTKKQGDTTLYRRVGTINQNAYPNATDTSVDTLVTTVTAVIIIPK